MASPFIGKIRWRHELKNGIVCTAKYSICLIIRRFHASYERFSCCRYWALNIANILLDKASCVFCEEHLLHWSHFRIILHFILRKRSLPQGFFSKRYGSVKVKVEVNFLIFAFTLILMLFAVALRSFILF